MTFCVIVTKDRDKPRSYRWTIRAGVNQPNELPLSRAEARPQGARRAAERVFGPLAWMTGEQAGSVYDYIIEVARVRVQGEEDNAPTP